MNSSENKAARRYPFDFTQTPTVVVSPAYHSTGDYFLVADVNNNVGTDKTHAPAYSIARPTTITVMKPRIAYYVVGR